MLNRLVMLETLVEGLGFKLPDLEMITSVHNFIGDDNIIRKGAISALAGEKVIIPWNMKKGLILGVGKGNPDWNNSAPHGAGRKMARGKAKRELSLEDFKRGMADAGVWSSCVDKDTLDESAEAYKDPEVIEKAIAPSVEVLQHLRSVYNFKSGGR
jgi:RNA-splicing ligase RtcB